MSLKKVLFLSKAEAKPFMGKPNVLKFNKPLNSVVNINLPENMDEEIDYDDRATNLVTPDDLEFVDGKWRTIRHKSKKKSPKKKNKTKRSLFEDGSHREVKERQREARNFKANDIRLRTGLAAENRRLWNIENAKRVADFSKQTKLGQELWASLQGEKYIKQAGSKKRKKFIN